MIATEVGGRQLRIFFKHERFPKPQEHERLNGNITFITAQTECRVVTGPKDAEVEVVKGFGRCSYADNFSYEEARQKSLFHALGYDRAKEMKDQKKLTLSAEEVGALLAAYFSRKSKKGKK